MTSAHHAGSSSATGPASGDCDVDLQKQLRELYSKFHLQCRKCRRSFPLEARDHVDTWLATSKTIPTPCQISALLCQKCDQLTCVGCGGMPTSNKDNVLKSPGLLNICCDEGRVFGVWLLLSAFDEREFEPDNKSFSLRTKPAKKASTASLKPYSGVGYGGGRFYAPNPFPTHNGLGASSIRPAKKSADALMTMTLQLLISSISESTSNLISDSAALKMLVLFRLSCFFDRVTALVRNDSITEMTERRDLYNAVISFLEAVSMNPTLQVLLFEQRLGKRGSPGLRLLSCGPYKPINSAADISASLFTSCNPTYRQVKAFLELIGEHGASSESSLAGGNKDSVRICKKVVQLYETMKQSNVVNAAVNAKEEPRDPWILYMEDNKVTFTDEVLKNHCFYKQSATPNNASPALGRMVAIGKEIANMTTSLPQGIFLKVAESRSDFMKVLIVGVEGSPYAHGLFIFDLFLDANYPTTPPQMKFVLSIDKSSFIPMNPNLHIGGTVCLSILNTWHGETQQMWQPNKSTILSVLISIQAMILGAPLPWLNEPGRETKGVTPKAREHNLVIQCKTVRYAMIAWLQKNMHKSQDIWKDVSDMYWKHHAEKVLQLVKEWAGSNPNLENRNTAKWTDPNFDADLGSGGSLVEILRGLLEPLLSSGEEESGRERRSTGKRKGKRRASGSNTASSLADSGFSMAPKRKKPSGSLQERNGPRRWVFTGEQTMKVVREACKEFGVCPARTIKESVERLEGFVNEKGKANKGSMDKWGLTKSAGRMDHEEDGGQGNEEEDDYQLMSAISATLKQSGS